MILPGTLRGAQMGSEFCAMERWCPHAGADLAEGDIEDFGEGVGKLVACPAHMFTFRWSPNNMCLNRVSGCVYKGCGHSSQFESSVRIIVYNGFDAWVVAGRAWYSNINMRCQQSPTQLTQVDMIHPVVYVPFGIMEHFMTMRRSLCSEIRRWISGEVHEIARSSWDLVCIDSAM